MGFGGPAKGRYFRVYRVDYAVVASESRRGAKQKEVEEREDERKKWAKRRMAR